MSWHLPVGRVALDEPTRSIPKAAERVLAELRAKGPSYAGQFDAPETSAEVAEQVAAAVEAANALTDGLGGDVQAVDVNLSGHANPGHEARTGWAPDTITVSVSVAPKE